jgi:hypothetical protein
MLRSEEDIEADTERSRPSDRSRVLLLEEEGSVATDAVPTRSASGSIFRAMWFHLIAGAALAVLAFVSLSVAQDRNIAFRLDGVANLRFDDRLFLPWVGATVVAGFLFGLARPGCLSHRKGIWRGSTGSMTC